jgi:hypothetical protein
MLAAVEALMFLSSIGNNEKAPGRQTPGPFFIAGRIGIRYLCPYGCRSSRGILLKNCGTNRSFRCFQLFQHMSKIICHL